jgi:Tfp pilus assembly protein PilE
LSILENNNSYLGAGTPTDTGSPKTSVFSSTVPVSGGTASYNLTIAATPAPTSTSYTLQATPVDSADACGTFILNNNGDQSVSTDKTDCW